MWCLFSLVAEKFQCRIQQTFEGSSIIRSYSAKHCIYTHGEFFREQGSSRGTNTSSIESASGYALARSVQFQPMFRS
jgi:hypothetical protein